jgi:REP element-mobilizing transposase RayT
MTRSRYTIHEPKSPHFLTCTVVNWLPLFSAPALVGILLDSWRFLQTQERLTIFAYVVMENHVHLVAASPDLGKEIGDFKSFTARRIIDHLQERKAHNILQQLVRNKAAHKVDREHQICRSRKKPRERRFELRNWLFS